MAIKNYTSIVDVHKSLGEIQGALASHGARKIMVDYDEGNRPVCVTFALQAPDGLRGFCLPANIEGVQAVFAQQEIKADPGQAERTAWRNLRDWVLAQMAIIEAGQAAMDQVFLPYLTDPQGRTLYEAYQGGRLSLGCGEGAP